MTPKYWFRIIFGMLAIFTVGMILRAGVRKGKHVVTDIAQGSGPITVPLLGLPFKLDDVKIGSLQLALRNRLAALTSSKSRSHGTEKMELAIRRLVMVVTFCLITFPTAKPS